MDALENEGDEADDDMLPPEPPEPEPEFEPMLDLITIAYEDRVIVPDPSSSPGEPEGGDERGEPERPAEPLEAAPDPPPPPADFAGGSQAKRKRVGGVVKLELDNGTITYYTSNQTMEAQCGRHCAERCTQKKRLVDKRARGSADVWKPRTRPLGFLALWLEVGMIHDKKINHCDQDEIEYLCGPGMVEFRKEARQELHATAAGRELLEIEDPASLDLGRDAEWEQVR